MDLKSILGGREEKNRELYWALVIEPSWIQAGIWEIVAGKADVISISPAAAWETEEEMIAAADTALSAAVQNLSEEAPEPSKTVFGVPSFWVTKGQIKDEFLAKIRKICTELSLQPVGFVVIPEAIAHLVKSEEATPLNGVVVGIGAEELELSIFKLGNLVGTTQVSRSVSIAEDVSEGLARFSQNEPLPTRILIYDGKEGELEDERQSLLNTNWEDFEKLKFLHTPKVEVLEPDRKVLATSLAGASEIANVSAVGAPSKEEFAETQPPKEEVENVKVPEKEVSAEELGFMVGQDVRANAPVAKPAIQAPAVSQEFIPTPSQNFKMSKVSLNFASVFTIFKKIHLPKLKIPAFGSQSFIFAGFFMVLLFILGFVYWWFVPTADVTIYVSPKKLSENSSLSVSTSATSPDIGAAILPGKVLTVEVSSDKTTQTTGTKTVGDKAKGSVNIRNGTASVLDLPAGTIIYGTNDLQFTLDSEASVSAQLSPGTPGTATVNVTASDIGTQYNLDKDVSFKVSNYPQATIDAVSTAAFTGGTSQEISAVSQDDQNNLEKSLTNELLDNAKTKLAKQVDAGRYFVGDGLISTETSKDFSNKVGDEASTLKLSLTLSVQGLEVDKKAFLDLAKAVLGPKLPSGYVLTEDQVKANFDFKKKTGNTYSFDIAFTANLLPQINASDIAKNIVGKLPSVAESYLTSTPGYSRVDISLKPHFPGRLGSLPRIVNHIHISVAAEQ